MPVSCMGLFLLLKGVLVPEISSLGVLNLENSHCGRLAHQYGVGVCGEGASRPFRGRQKNKIKWRHTVMRSGTHVITSFNP